MKSEQENQPAGAKPAQQARSRETTQAIVRALEHCLKAKGFEQITMAELAKEAGISPGAIYRRFENKDSLLPYVFSRYREELDSWLGRVTPERLISEYEGLDAVLEAIVAETYGCFHKNSHIFRTVHLYGRLYPKAVPESGSDNHEFEPLASVLAAFKDEITKPPRKAAVFLGFTLISMCTERALYPEQLPAKQLKLSDKRFAEDMAAMFAAWLKAPGD